MESVIKLDGLPHEVKEAKSEVTKALYSFVLRRLRFRQDVDIPFIELERLMQIAAANVVDVKLTLTSAVIQTIKLLIFRIRPSWNVHMKDVNRVLTLFVTFLKERGVGDLQVNDVRDRVRVLEDRVRGYNVDVKHRPILLLGDSMFVKTKPSSDLFPLAFSGQTAEGLRVMLQNVEPRMNISDVVITHGLNHTNDYGSPEKDIIVIKEFLARNYPMARLFHLQLPVSPKMAREDGMMRRALRFNGMMKRLGFQSIPHPRLNRDGFDRDQFHYSNVGRSTVEKKIVHYVRGQ